MVKDCLLVTRLYGSFAHPRRDLPANTATLLLSVLPRGYELARSAFGVLAAPAAADAVLARMASVALDGRGHDALHKQCVFLQRVSADPRLCGPRAASASARPNTLDVVTLLNSDFSTQLNDDHAEIALIRLSALGTRTVPIVVHRHVCSNTHEFQAQNPAHAPDTQLRAQRMCESVRQRGGVCNDLAVHLINVFAVSGVGFLAPDLRLPDIVLSAA